MKHLIRFGALVALLVGTLSSACVVREQRVARATPAPCAGAVWVEGHYGEHARWHRAHWECPGYVERVY